MVLSIAGGARVTAAAPSPSTGEKSERAGLETPPGTFELDLVVGGGAVWAKPDEGPSAATVSLIVRPAAGYFLSPALMLRAGLLYAADLTKDGPDAHQIAPGVGLRWLFRPGAALRPFLGMIGGAGVRIAGGDPALAYGFNLDAGLLVAFSPRVASQMGVSFRFRWFRDPDAFSLVVPFGNIGVSAFFF